MTAARKILPVVLSGGSGTRLWPLSRSQYPKQLLPLVEDLPMLAATCRRVADPGQYLPPVIICNEAHRFIVAEQLRAADITPAAIILEPVGRNSAPAAATAALFAERYGPETQVLLLASDSHIARPEAFAAAVAAGSPAAAAGSLVTFGVTPTRPETGYGYIQLGQAHAAAAGAFTVARFVEKPDAETAQAYLAAGGYVWNSGTFLYRADRMAAELATRAPAILDACRTALERATADLDFLRLDRDAFAACPSDSIDYAVMEKAADVAVVPADMGWSDVGSWAALWDIAAKDGAGNVFTGDVVAEDVSGCYIRDASSTTGRSVAAVGVRDLILVVTDDVVLVVPRARAQDVKKLVDKMKMAGRPELDAHRLVHRPWGSYQSVDAGPRFQVKRLMVKPGGRLSAQMHYHRAEHWVVVHGTARVTRGEETVLLHENQSIYIPIGTKHRLENPGKLALELIEVQSGPYLGEDDIVRFQDDYGRG